MNSHEPISKIASSCCHASDKEDAHAGHHHPKGGDWLLRISLAIVAAGCAAHLLAGGWLPPFFARFSAASAELLGAMWWGVAAGIVFVGLMGRIPREFIMKILGRSGSLGGILRACLGGVLLDLCSHGILLVGMKLYERGASAGQVIAFLLSSPWNSFSLTLILISLIGVTWTLLFILLSLVIAAITGLIFERLEQKGVLPPNPNHTEHPPADFRFFHEAKTQLAGIRWNLPLLLAILREGWRDAKPVLRWVFVGIVLGAAIRSAVPDEHFAHYFGATFVGLVLTMLAATVIEVCSEGATPIAADLLTRAGAPGNSFAFLMAGVSTDYTEIMALKETTRSWKIAFFLPLISLPQIMAVAWLVNHFAVGG